MPKLYQMTKKKKEKAASAKREEARKRVEERLRLWERAEQGDVKALITLGKQILGQTD